MGVMPSQGQEPENTGDYLKLKRDNEGSSPRAGTSFWRSAPCLDSAHSSSLLSFRLYQGTFKARYLIKAFSHYLNGLFLFVIGCLHAALLNVSLPTTTL